MKSETWSNMTEEEQMEHARYEKIWRENRCEMHRKVIDDVDYYFKSGNNRAYRRVGTDFEDISVEEYLNLDAEDKRITCLMCPWWWLYKCETPQPILFDEEDEEEKEDK